jgi:CheY-like chemotaxis protein
MKTMKIMIVEDDSRVRKMIHRIVEGLAASIHECSNGEEAVEACARISPDVILMDLMLGGMDGLAATRAIRRSHPQARIIIVTSYDEQDLRESAREAGASEYVIKENLLELRRLLLTPVGCQQSRP